MGKRLTFALAIAAFVSLAALYVVTYLSLVEAKPLRFMSGEGPWRRDVHYRAGGRLAEWLFAPIQSVDERIRPRHWHEDDLDPA